MENPTTEGQAPNGSLGLLSNGSDVGGSVQAPAPRPPRSHGRYVLHARIRRESDGHGQETVVTIDTECDVHDVSAEGMSVTLRRPAEEDVWQQIKSLSEDQQLPLTLYEKLAERGRALSAVLANFPCAIRWAKKIHVSDIETGVKLGLRFPEDPIYKDQIERLLRTWAGGQHDVIEPNNNPRPAPWWLVFLSDDFTTGISALGVAAGVYALVFEIENESRVKFFAGLMIGTTLYLGVCKLILAVTDLVRKLGLALRNRNSHSR